MRIASAMPCMKVYKEKSLLKLWINYQRSSSELHRKKRLEKKLNQLKRNEEIEKFKKQEEETLKKLFVQESNVFMKKS